MWQDYLSKSERNLVAAERDLAAGSYDPCVSRAYFAAFQAAIAALLALTDFQRRGRYWDHGEIAAEFVRRLIHRRKVFPQTMAGTLDELKSRRHQADYDHRQISQRVAERSVSKARQFVQLVDTTLQELRTP
jgi:uncharacterized protein (UPF0332 family)